MNVELSINGEKVELNEFVEKILGGTVVGAVTSLRGVKNDWAKIEIRVKR